MQKCKNNTHASAFGVCIKEENVDELIKLSNELLKDYDFNQVYKIDFLMNPSNIDEKYIYKLNEMKHLWGTRLDEPRLMVTDLKISAENLELIGKQSNIIKIQFKGVEYIMFRAEDKIKELGQANSYNITLVGKPNVNEWGGNVIPQIIMDDSIIKSESSFVF